MRIPLNQKWELDSIFPGGSQSPEFSAFLDSLEGKAKELTGKLEQTRSPLSEEEAEAFFPLVEQLQKLLRELREAESFTGCLMAQDQGDRKALQLNGRVVAINASYQSLLTQLDRVLSGIPGDLFARLMKREPWSPIRFYLEERRNLAAEKMDAGKESLANDLAVDGYHAWGDLYNATVSRIRIPYEEKGQEIKLSAGQAFNKLHTPNRAERERLFKLWEDTWADQADFCSEALNHLAGFRLRLYGKRGWDSIHKEPLAINRMSQQTLDTMWGVIGRNKDILLRFLERKAKLLGVERLDWHDVDAPLGGAAKEYTYDEGSELIVKQFGEFSPKMAEFAQMALESRWVEAEDRPGKRPGGFCTSFPISKQTRIFMTFGNTASNVSTLAHELGHAFHQHVMDDLPAMSQEYAMNVAETASTFAELIVSDAAIRQAESREEKIALLEDKIGRSIAFFMNIHARFIFETNFYAERSKGLVSVERLNELMVDAQKQAYFGALGEYHPHFWAAKLHFYATDVPFYNFPYTFGYLFSAGIYAEARKQGEGFEEKYIALLRDTGRMSVEELALKHLGANLQQPEFWQRAADECAEDVRQFLELTE